MRNPTPDQVKASLRKWIPSKTDLSFEPGWATRGRSWFNGIRATTVHHWAGVGDGGAQWMSQQGTSAYPYCNIIVRRDGRVRLLSALSAWHSGAGGPWGKAGIPKDAGHLMMFGIEMEGPLSSTKYGTDDMTDVQWKRVAQINCAIREVAGSEAFPGFNRVISHQCWTDGCHGVSKNPLPTVGRKNDVWRDIREVRAEAREMWQKKTNN